MNNQKVIHIRPNGMSDKVWADHLRENNLKFVPMNRKARRRAAALARRSVKVLQRSKGSSSPDSSEIFLKMRVHAIESTNSSAR